MEGRELTEGEKTAAEVLMREYDQKRSERMADEWARGFDGYVVKKFRSAAKDSRARGKTREEFTRTAEMVGRIVFDKRAYFDPIAEIAKIEPPSLAWIENILLGSLLQALSAEWPEER